MFSPMLSSVFCTPLMFDLSLLPSLLFFMLSLICSPFLFVGSLSPISSNFVPVLEFTSFVSSAVYFSFVLTKPLFVQLVDVLIRALFIIGRAV